MTNAWNRINTTLLLLVLFALLAVISLLATDARGGPLDPAGPPGPTLPQVEARSPIPPVGWNGAFPIVISQSGSYVFTRSLTGTSEGINGIQITAPNVSIDMNGFTLSGFNQTGSGIAVTGVLSGIRISNGIVRKWDVGINGWGGDAANMAVFSRVDGVTAIANFSFGISLGFDSEVTDCNASQTFDGAGIDVLFSVVRNCHVTDNVIGIDAQDQTLIEGNRIFNNTRGIRLMNGSTGGGTVVRSNAVIGNTQFDIAVLAGSSNDLLDTNTVTCPGKLLLDASTKIYDIRYQRDPC